MLLLKRSLLFGRHLAVSVLGLLAFEAEAQGFTKIADRDTSIPGGTGTFQGLSVPQISLGNVVFTGSGTGGQRGIYRFDPETGAVAAVVDLNTPLPGGGQLSTVEGVSMFGPDVSFLNNAGRPDAGLYTTRGGGLHRIPGVETNLLPLPGFENSYANPRAPTSMDDQQILFRRSYTFRRLSGGPGIIVETFGRASDSGNASLRNEGLDVHRFLARDGRTIFSSNYTSTGFKANAYLSASAGTFEFSDSSTAFGPQRGNLPLPGEPSTSYTFLGAAPLFNDDGESTVLVAYSSPDADINHRTQWGVYAMARTTPLRTIANNLTVIPGRTDGATFSFFSAVAVDGANIVFIGGPVNGNPGIYTESGGRLAKVISVGDVLDGKMVAGLLMSDDRPLSGNELVFSATFTGGSHGLYMTQVPEPAGLILIGGVAFLISRRVIRTRG